MQKTSLLIIFNLFSWFYLSNMTIYVVNRKINKKRFLFLGGKDMKKNKIFFKDILNYKAVLAIMIIILFITSSISNIPISLVSGTTDLDEPGETIPLITQEDSKTKDVTFQTSGQSMWKDGIPPDDITYDMTSELSTSGVDDFKKSIIYSVPGLPGWVVDILEHTYLLSAPFGADLSLDSEAGIQMKADLHGFEDGTVDITYPVNIDVTYPLANTFWAGDIIELDPNAVELAGAALNTNSPNVNFTLLSDISLSETLTGKIILPLLGEQSLGSKEIIEVSFDDIELLSVDDEHGPYVWDIDPSPIKGKLEMPSLNIVSGNLEASDNHMFSDLFIDIDEFYSPKYKKVGVPLDYKSDNYFGIDFGYTILSANLFHDTQMNQDIKFTPTTYVRFIFSDPVIYEGSMVTEIITKTGLPKDLKLPEGWTDPITVIPSVLVENQFYNKYYINGTNKIVLEAGKVYATIPGIPLLPIEITVINPDVTSWKWTCPCDTYLFGACICPVPEKPTMTVGPYTTPEFPISIGPVITQTWSEGNAETIYEQTFELGGFQEIGLSTFDLDPQVKPYPVPLSSGHPPYEVDEGSIIMLDGSESYDLDDDPLRLYWDLDSGTEFEDPADHEFETSGATPTYLGIEGPGIYNIRLMANDPYGYRIESTDVIVNNVAPTIDTFDMIYFILNDYRILPNRIGVMFSGSFTDPGWHDTHTCVWDFGDGLVEPGFLREENNYPDSTGTIMRTKHVYRNPGVYNVTLTITDDDGASTSATTTVNVD